MKNIKSLGAIASLEDIKNIQGLEDIRVYWIKLPKWIKEAWKNEKIVEVFQYEVLQPESEHPYLKIMGREIEPDLVPKSIYVSYPYKDGDFIEVFYKFFYQGQPLKSGKKIKMPLEEVLKLFEVEVKSTTKTYTRDEKKIGSGKEGIKVTAITKWLPIPSSFVVSDHVDLCTEFIEEPIGPKLVKLSEKKEEISRTPIRYCPLGFNGPSYAAEVIRYKIHRHREYEDGSVVDDVYEEVHDPRD